MNSWAAMGADSFIVFIVARLAVASHVLYNASNHQLILISSESWVA